MLQGLARGETNAMIAERFNISPATVNESTTSIITTPARGAPGAMRR